MSGFFQNLLKDVGRGLIGDEYLRDYQHASKTFRPDMYALAPKYKFLFHVYFDINPSAGVQFAGQPNFGLAVKTIKLPGYTMAVAAVNQYNRKRLIQTKQNYQPIDVTFHDDNSNMITQLWHSYWTYYYGDGRQHSTPNQSTAIGIGRRTTYQNTYSGLDNWGYLGEGNNNKSKPPFFNSIQIFGFHQKNFIKYTLINPLITDFRHDTYSYEGNAGVMTNTMSVDYETVNYEVGAMDGSNPGTQIPLFGQPANYDLTPSPINRPGSNKSILGPNGLLDAAGGFTKAISEGNILGAAIIAGRATNTFKNTSLKTLAKGEVKGIAGAVVGVAAVGGILAANQAVQNTVRNNTFNTPAYGSTGQPSGTAGRANPQAKSAPAAVGPDTAAP